MIKNNVNEAKNKAQNFNDKLAIFNRSATKSENNNLLPKKNQKPSLNREYTEPITKENKNKFINNKKNSKKEEKPKETKNVLNCINQINNKNNSNEVKKSSENNSFQASLNIFKNENKEKNVNNLKKNEIKEKEKEKKDKKKPEIINKFENKQNLNNKIDKKENEKESKQKVEDSFKNRLSVFDKFKEQKNDKEKEKINLNDKNKQNIEDKNGVLPNVSLPRKITIQERINQLNKDNKEEENKNKNNKQIKENQNNSIQDRATVFATTNKTYNEIRTINKIQQDKKPSGVNIQQKVQNFQKPNDINKNQEMKYKINKTCKKKLDSSALEKLILLYQPKDTSTNTNSNINKTIKTTFNVEEIIKKINQKEKEKKAPKLNVIKNINQENPNKNNMNNASKIFNTNIEKMTSMVKESKKQEIIKFVQELEENQKIEKEIDSDNSEYEKEKDDIIDNNLNEEEGNFNILENLPNIDMNIKPEKGRESYKVDNLINKIRDKYNFSKIDSKQFEIIDKDNFQDDENIIIDKSTNFNDNTEDTIKLNIDEISKKMNKALPLFNKMDSSSSISADDIFLPKEILPQSKKPEHSTFCEGFFLASFSKDKSKIMENSLDNQAECNHSICNIMPAMQPEILYKYPKEDIKGLEINNLAASICFPNGIKLCYEEKEENIKTVKNYRSSFTNQVGDRFFAVTYHFFLRKENSEFESEQNMSPFQYEIIKYQDEIRTLLNDEQAEDIYDRLIILDNISKRDYVNIPYCLCLISKYPFIEQMEKCLESIMMSINDENLPIKDLNKYISYIVSSIPAPSDHCKILFPLAYHYKLEEIQPQYFKDINQFGDNPLIILSHISEKNIYTLFKLLIFEQKVIIVGKDNDLVSQMILNFVTLLYPFEWVHTFLPIMSEKMLKFLQAFLPFFIGMNITLLKKAKPILAQAAKGVFIFNIDNNTIEINSNYKQDAKSTNTLEYINRHIPNFPKALEQLIMKELKLIKREISKNKDSDKLFINLRIKNLFMQILAELLYDYKKYSYIVDDLPVFNSFLLINDKDKKESEFYKEFTSTQLFQMFIQNSLFRPEDKVSYFEERLYDFQEVKKRGATMAYNLEKLNQKYIKDYTKFAEIKKKYVIKPFFIKEFKKIEDENVAKNKKIKLSDIVKFLSKHYDKPKFTQVNDHGVLYENKRVIKKSIELNNDNDPKEIPIYYIPKSKDESKDNIGKKGENIKKIKSIKVGIIAKEEDNKKNNIKISQILPNKTNELTEDEIDDIKDNIREIMARIYKSDVRKIEDDKKVIIDSLRTQFGREYFTNIIYNGYKQDNLVKNLINQSYNFFLDVIFNTLLDILKLEENEENIICAVKLLKSCQYIATVKNKRKFLLSDELYNKLEKYSLFDKIRFWEYWIDDEMTKEELIIKQSILDLTYIETESQEYKLYSEHLFSIIEKLISIMLKMKISNSSILSITYDLSNEYLTDDLQIKKLKDEVCGQLQIFKTYSKRK